MACFLNYDYGMSQHSLDIIMSRTVAALYSSKAIGEGKHQPLE